MHARQCGKTWGVQLTKRTGEGEGNREERSTLRRIPRSSSACTLPAFPVHILPWHHNPGGSADAGCTAQVLFKKAWKNCPAERFHTRDAVSNFLLISDTQTGK